MNAEKRAWLISMGKCDSRHGGCLDKVHSDVTCKDPTCTVKHSFKCDFCRRRNYRRKDYGMASRNHITKINAVAQLTEKDDIIIFINPAGRPLTEFRTKQSKGEIKLVPNDLDLLKGKKLVCIVDNEKEAKYLEEHFCVQVLVGTFEVKLWEALKLASTL